MFTTRTVLLVGNPGPTHVGAHLIAAASGLDVELLVADLRDAWTAPVWRQKAEWWLRGHRPAALRTFSERVTLEALQRRVDLVLTTGLAPVDAAALQRLKGSGIVCANFLTDDPWNPAHRAPWFFDALARYDLVFSPRRGNMTDLSAVGGPTVEYLPFGFDPGQHFPDPPVDPAECERFSADLVFAGGADPDRAEVLGAFVRAGLDVSVYGGYWERYRATRSRARGHLDTAELRRAVGGAKVSLCLVRRANRDGQSMRTYEVAAMGGCMLVEHTPEHEELFGADGETVVYFSTIGGAVTAARSLLADDDRRAHLGARVRALMTSGGHTYQNRLRRLLDLTDAHRHENRLRHSGPLSRV